MTPNYSVQIDPSIHHHVVSLEECGAVSVYVQVTDREDCYYTLSFYSLQGELEKHKEGVVFLTVHDVGASYLTWKQFVQDISMDDIRKRWGKYMRSLINHYFRASFIHVALPGQIPGERDLPKDFIFPKMKVKSDFVLLWFVKTDVFL